MRLSHLTIVSVVISLFGFLTPMADFLPPRFQSLLPHDFDNLFRIALWCLLFSIALAIYGIAKYRLRGAWLILPVLISLYWPIVLFHAACNVDTPICG